MAEGRILQALRGFWYIETEEGILECRALGKLRYEGVAPLVGDLAEVTPLGGGKGSLTALKPRKNAFIRPAVANVDALVVLASAAPPVTDPFLIDRVVAIAELKDCQPILCFHKCDLARDEALWRVYRDAGFRSIQTSAVTGEGIETLKEAVAGKFCAFTGNSGVGKSSLLNALEPRLSLETDAISAKLGRGKHTTRHVTLYTLGCGATAADTPGFSSFDAEDVTLAMKRRLPELFREFRPYLGLCRYADCAHERDAGCAVRAAVERGEISTSRHNSYIRLRRETAALQEWQFPN